ncbi:hypothetical protein Hanom_Chr16g01484791 [Helianthus anomalus]
MTCFVKWNKTHLPWLQTVQGQQQHQQPQDPNQSPPGPPSTPYEHHPYHLHPLYLRAKTLVLHNKISFQLHSFRHFIKHIECITLFTGVRRHVG